MNFSISGTGLLVALALVTVPLMLLVLALLILHLRSHSKTVSLLRSEVKRLTTLNQSLLNQVRASDLPSLVSLQQLTTPESLTSEEYVPSWDEYAAYQQAMQEAGNYVEERVPDEFDAAGWEGTVSPVSGGGPVRFTG